jgi:hypothetical protein
MKTDKSARRSAQKMINRRGVGSARLGVGSAYVGLKARLQPCKTSVNEKFAMKKECLIGWNASQRLAFSSDVGGAYAERGRGQKTKTTL